MLEKFSPYIATGALILSLILALFSYQQGSTIAELQDKVMELQPVDSPNSPNNSNTSFNDQKRIDAKLAALEAKFARQNRMLRTRINSDGDLADVGEPGSLGTLAAAQGGGGEIIPLEVLEDESHPAREQLRELLRTENERIREERREARNQRRMQEFEEEFKEFATKHSLTQAQQDVILPKLKEERSQFSDLMRARRDGDMDRDEIRSQIQSIRKETDEAVILELDAEQQKAYLDQRQQEEERFGRRGRGRGGDRAGNQGTRTP